MTSAWWLDASPQACWPLIADAHRWPIRWRSLPETGGRQRLSVCQRHARAWRVLLGLPLRLQARQRISSPCELSEWQIDGDLHARLTWVLVSVSAGGCDVTCRWEIGPLFAGPAWLRTVARLLLERRHFRRMRACARGMAIELGCDCARLREWSGLTNR